jgi:aspartyl-tRNA(Asn)/glutamyl-tRNA(Gln) amidotransferase subunit C
MKLARLAVDDAEVHRLRRDLAAVLAYMERLSAVDVSGVTPMTHGDVSAMRLREDEPKEARVREAALAQAPESRAGHFAVPRVIGGEESP